MAVTGDCRCVTGVCVSALCSVHLALRGKFFNRVREQVVIFLRLLASYSSTLDLKWEKWAKVFTLSFNLSLFPSRQRQLNSLGMSLCILSIFSLSVRESTWNVGQGKKLRQRKSKVMLRHRCHRIYPLLSSLDSLVTTFQRHEKDFCISRMQNQHWVRTRRHWLSKCRNNMKECEVCRGNRCQS